MVGITVVMGTNTASRISGHLNYVICKNVFRSGVEADSLLRKQWSRVRSPARRIGANPALRGFSVAIDL